MRRSTPICLAGAVLAAALVTTASSGTSQHVRIPIKCSRGPSEQWLETMITFPATQAPGARFTVQIGGGPPGKVSHFGLNYVRDQGVDYLEPVGARYVDGSAHFVPDTGTPNVRAGARVWHDASGLHTLLPGHVNNGATFASPTLEFQLDVTAAAGQAVSLELDQYRVTANAFLVGDLRTTCVPTPRPYIVGTTLVTAEPPR